MKALATTSAAERSLAALGVLFEDQLGRDVAIRLWDGTSVAAPNARFELIVRTPFGLRAAFAPPLDLNPGRAFVEGWIDIAGDVEAAVDTLERRVERLSKLALARLAALLVRLPAPPKADDRRPRLVGKTHSKARDAAAISFHYDLPVAFYKTFLDRDLVYSCAYWDDGTATLDDAQRAKLDYVLDKLRLRPGERLLDIGCGWGALVLRAAQRGVRAVGITLSRRQYEEARRRIAAAGLEETARVDLRDYRDLGDEEFDGVASIGMVEHVGRERLREYFDVAYRALRSGGLFLNHGITAQTRDGRGFRARRDFMGRYVFPDGDLVAFDMRLRSAEAAGFEVRDVENLREHYARTLHAWVANLAANRAAAIDAADARTERVWRLYMSASARGFALGRMGLIQSLLAKPGRDGANRIPSTRRDLYRPSP
ncbi:MAG TPA: cyclopropane-fatty-acyl-phospholipid synthase family protein [Candidatus Tumulicola sp.]